MRGTFGAEEGALELYMKRELQAANVLRGVTQSAAANNSVETRIKRPEKEETHQARRNSF